MWKFSVCRKTISSLHSIDRIPPLLVVQCVSKIGQAKQVKFAYGGLILGLSQFYLLPQLPQKNDARFKSGQKEARK